MGSSSVEIIRQQLREKFPQAHGLRAEPQVSESDTQPFHADAFPLGAISEVIPAGPVAGILSMVAGLLGEDDEAGLQPEMVLVDGADGFDPGFIRGCSLLEIAVGALSFRAGNGQGGRSADSCRQSTFHLTGCDGA